MHYKHTIEPSELADLLRQENVVVFDVRFSLADADAGKRSYSQGHIPGSYYLHLDDDLSGPVTLDSGRHPLPLAAEFAARLRERGVSNDTEVIVYDDSAGAFAARLWWLLNWLGHDHVAILDGGISAWLGAGRELSTAEPPRRAGDLSEKQREGLVVSTDELRRLLNSGLVILVDAREPERFRGEVEPIDKVAGHVPGAVNLPFQDNLDDDGRFLSQDALSTRHCFSDESKDVVYMCGSGVTACHNILAAVIGKQPMPKLYAGSWSEWIADAEREVATGLE